MDVVTNELMSDLGGKWYSCGGCAPGLFDLDGLLAASNNTNPIPRSARANTTTTDKLFYIYTRYVSRSRSRAHATRARARARDFTHHGLIYLAAPRERPRLLWFRTSSS
jgi:hypothetical protein